MSDRDGTLNTPSDRTLASALRALPDAAPQPDLWPDLARALDERRRAFPSPAKRGKVPKADGGALKVQAHHTVAKSKGTRVLKFLPVALAASIVLAMVLPRSKPEPAAPDTIPAIADTTPMPTSSLASERSPTVPDELEGLHTRSQTLERWIAAVAARAPQDSRDLMAAVEMEDLIGLVDVQLGAAHDRTEALPLWRQRVALLEDLATIRGSAYAIAANDDGASNDSAASLNRIN